MSYGSQAVRRCRLKHKKLLVEEAGGKCVDCGVAYPAFVMQFDHRDPTTKAFGIGGTRQTHSLVAKRLEAEKCDLVCANCHAYRTHNQRCTDPECEYRNEQWHVA